MLHSQVSHNTTIKYTTWLQTRAQLGFIQYSRPIQQWFAEQWQTRSAKQCNSNGTIHTSPKHFLSHLVTQREALAASPNYATVRRRGAPPRLPRPGRRVRPVASDESMR